MSLKMEEDSLIYCTETKINTENTGKETKTKTDKSRRNDPVKEIVPFPVQPAWSNRGRMCEPRKQKCTFDELYTTEIFKKKIAVCRRYV